MLGLELVLVLLTVTRTCDAIDYFLFFLLLILCSLSFRVTEDSNPCPVGTSQAGFSPYTTSFYSLLYCENLACEVH